ncbi:MAG: hypothetical protein ACRDJ0_15595 [Actinomycetota bacterium]
MKVAIGIDSHKDSLAAAAVDELGRVLGVMEVSNDHDDTPSCSVGGSSSTERSASGSSAPAATATRSPDRWWQPAATSMRRRPT